MSFARFFGARPPKRGEFQQLHCPRGLTLPPGGGAFYPTCCRRLPPLRFRRLRHSLRHVVRRNATLPLSDVAARHALRRTAASAQLRTGRPEFEQRGWGVGGGLCSARGVGKYVAGCRVQSAECQEPGARCRVQSGERPALKKKEKYQPAGPFFLHTLVSGCPSGRQASRLGHSFHTHFARGALAQKHPKIWLL